MAKKAFWYQTFTNKIRGSLYKSLVTEQKKRLEPLEFRTALIQSFTPVGVDYELGTINGSEAQFKSLAGKYFLYESRNIFLTFLGLNTRQIDPNAMRLSFSDIAKNMAGWRSRKFTWTNFFLMFMMLPLNLIAWPINFILNIGRLLGEILPIYAQVLFAGFLYYGLSFLMNELEVFFDPNKSKIHRCLAILYVPLLSILSVLITVIGIIGLPLAYLVQYATQAVLSPIASVKRDWLMWERFTRGETEHAFLKHLTYMTWLRRILQVSSVLLRITTAGVICAILFPLATKGLSLALVPFMATHLPTVYVTLVHTFGPIVNTVGQACSIIFPAFYTNLVSIPALAAAPVGLAVGSGFAVTYLTLEYAITQLSKAAMYCGEKIRITATKLVDRMTATKQQREMEQPLVRPQPSNPINPKYKRVQVTLAEPDEFTPMLAVAAAAVALPKLTRIAPLKPAAATAPAVEKLINLTDLDIGKELGRGGFGVVHKGHFEGKTVAIKALLAEHNGNHKLVNDLVSEGKMIAGLRHPNIVEYIGTYKGTDAVYLVLGFCAGGALDSFLRTEAGMRLSTSRRLDIAKDVCQGMAFLFLKQILHRDFKSPNVLLDENGTAKVSDFGLSKQESKATIGDFKGTPRWIAPEYYATSQCNLPITYTFEGDAFALGLVIYEIFSGQYPLPEEENSFNAMQRHSRGERSTISENTPSQARAVISSLWDQNPDARSTPQAAAQRLAQRRQI